MPFSNEDKAFIKDLHQFKEYGSQRILTEFSGKKLEKETTGHLNEKHRKQETPTKGVRLKPARPEENGVTKMDQLVGLLSQMARHTHRSTRHVSSKTSLTQSSIIGIIHCDAGLKCLFCLPKRLFPVIANFSYIYISQGSVATQLRCGWIFSNRVIANCQQSVSEILFLNWSIFGQYMDNGLVARFCGSRCTR